MLPPISDIGVGEGGLWPLCSGDRATDQYPAGTKHLLESEHVVKAKQAQVDCDCDLLLSCESVVLHLAIPRGAANRQALSQQGWPRRGAVAQQPRQSR